VVTVNEKLLAKVTGESLEPHLLQPGATEDGKA
jgi:hypothetical protein